MHKHLKPLFREIKKEYKFFGPVKNNREVIIQEIVDPDNYEFTQKQPLFSFKKFFLPSDEPLFDYDNFRIQKGGHEEKIALLGANILDLKYILLYDLVFAQDQNYQRRRQNLLILAHNLVPESQENFTHRQFDESVLMQNSYDIFFVFNGNQKVDLVAGSKKGKAILEDFKIPFRDLAWRQIRKPAFFEGIPQKIQQNLLAEKNQKVWEELNERCLRCGKCTLVCPTCFCFRLDDQPNLEEQTGQRKRCWDSCFFDEFHEVGGGHDFQPAIANRIHFWYFHKFARIPKEFNMTGCVGCKRCFRVCPAGIDIEETIKKLLS